MSLALDTILSDYSSMLEVVVEFDSIKRSDGSTKTWYFSTRPRETSASETPASTQFLPFVPSGGVLGPFQQSITEDNLFSSLASISTGSITLVQSNPDVDLLSSMYDYVFAGSACRIRIGRATDLLSSFVLVRTVVVEVDPVVSLTPDGLQAEFQLSSVSQRLLSESLIAKRYVGIPHCINALSTTFVAIAPYNSAYVIPNFTIGFKMRTSALPGVAKNMLTRVQASPLRTNFALQFRTDGKMQMGYTHSAGTLITIVPTMDAIADGEWHLIIWGWLNKTTTYMVVDDTLIYQQSITHDVDLPTTGDIWLGRLAIGKTCDYRIYNSYIPPDEARGIFAVRSGGDEVGCVGLWRMDDNAGSTANDYSSISNDATLIGTINVDYKWDASELGEPEIAGNIYPINVGNVLNAQAQVIDTNRRKLRGNNDSTDWYQTPGSTNLTVRSQGTTLTGGGTDYTAPSDGGDGVFTLTSAEVEPITYDLLNNGVDEEDYYPSSIVQRLLTNRTTISSSAVKNVESLQLLCPWPSGYYSATETNAQAAVSEILSQNGLYCREDESGNIYLDCLLPPTGYGPYDEPCLDVRGFHLGGVEYGDIGDLSSSGTIAFWVKVHLLDQTTYNFSGSDVVFVDKGGNYSVVLQTTGVNAGKIKFNIASTDLRSPVGVLSAHQWYFVACVFDDTANTMKIYVGAEGGSLIEVASGSNALSSTINSNPFKIGGTGYPWYAFQHLHVWSVAKSQAQLESLMITPPLGTESNLLVYVPGNEGIGNPREIVSSTSGTLTGSSLVPVWCPKFTVDLDVTPSVKLSNLHHTHPAGEVIIHYAKNQFPMQDGDIDTGVSASTRLFLKSPYKSIRWEMESSVRTRYLKAKKIILNSTTTDQESAQRLLRMIRDRFGTDHYVGSLQFPNSSSNPLNLSRLSCGLTLGDEIGLVSTNPAILQTPRSFRVVSIAPNFLHLVNNVIFWG